MQQTSEYNEKEADSQIKRIKEWLPVGKGERGGAIQGVGDQEVQTIRYKISYKDILYNCGDIANIL